MRVRMLVHLFSTYIELFAYIADVRRLYEISNAITITTVVKLWLYASDIDSISCVLCYAMLCYAMGRAKTENHNVVNGRAWDGFFLLFLSFFLFIAIMSCVVFINDTTFYCRKSKKVTNWKYSLFTMYNNSWKSVFASFSFLLVHHTHSFLSDA